MLKITLTQGLIGKKDTQRRVVKALGLGKYGSEVVRVDTPVIRGMIDKVSHLVTVTEVADDTKPGKVARRDRTKINTVAEAKPAKAKAKKESK
jgi:large subunit ribosomal protein L30